MFPAVPVANGSRYSAPRTRRKLFTTYWPTNRLRCADGRHPTGCIGESVVRHGRFLQSAHRKPCGPSAESVLGARKWVNPGQVSKSPAGQRPIPTRSVSEGVGVRKYDQGQRRERCRRAGRRAVCPWDHAGRSLADASGWSVGPSLTLGGGRGNGARAPPLFHRAGGHFKLAWDIDRV